jgi:hypothetical protein
MAYAIDFVTAVSNSDDRKGADNNTKKEETHTRTQYQKALPQTVDVNLIHNKNGPAKITPSTLGLMFRRISEISTNADIKASQDLDILNGYFYHIKISQYCDDGLLYESDSERIQKLKNSLKKQYHLYSECY